MPNSIAFDARRFKSAASHYLAGRSAYPHKLIADVAKLTNLTHGDRVLDLGCGPGQLALAFAPLVQSVLAVDPEPEMLELCERQRQQAGLANIETRLGSSNDLDAKFGSFKLVSIGRAFHWMDRVETLHRLDSLVMPAGAVVLFGDHHPDLHANQWITDFDRIVDHYAAADPGRAIRQSPDWISHEAILLASSFSQLERLSIIEQRTLSGETLIERALSRSSTTAARLGMQATEMVDELRRHFGLDQSFIEVVELQALIAKRSFD